MLIHGMRYGQLDVEDEPRLLAMMTRRLTLREAVREVPGMWRRGWYVRVSR